MVKKQVRYDVNDEKNDNTRDKNEFWPIFCNISDYCSGSWLFFGTEDYKTGYDAYGSFLFG